MVGPGQRGRRHRRDRVLLPVLGGERVHEVETLVGDPVEQHRRVRRIDRVPAHVRQDGRLEFAHNARPLAEPRRLVSALDAVLEQHLHADADAEHGTTAGEPTLDELAAAHRIQLVHDGRERADAGHDQAVGRGDLRAVGGQLDGRARELERLGGRVNVAGAVVEDHDGRSRC